jgi:broad specificity phosphatase PhoE
MIIYLVRHAKSEANKINTLFNGNLKGKLTKEGIVQASKIAEFLKDIYFKDCFVSEETRSQETAKIILDNNNLSSDSFKVDNRINELNPGILSGLTTKEIEKRFGDILEKRAQDKFNFIIPDGESYNMLINRLKKYLKNLLSRNYQENDNVLVVTHATTIKLFLYILSNKSLEEIESYHYNPTCLSIIKFNSLDDYEILTFNSEKHLNKK